MEGSWLIIFVGLNFWGSTLIYAIHYALLTFVSIGKWLCPHFSLASLLFEATTFSKKFGKLAGLTFPCLREEGNPFDLATISQELWASNRNLLWYVAYNTTSSHNWHSEYSIKCTITGTADNIQEILSKEDLRCHASSPSKENESMWWKLKNWLSQQLALPCLVPHVKSQPIPLMQAVQVQGVAKMWCKLWSVVPLQL